MAHEFVEYKEETGACKACGNSPVNHRGIFLLSTIDVWSAEVSKRASAYRVYRAFMHSMQRLLTHVDSYSYRALAFFGAIRFSSEVSRASTYRSQVIWEEAQRRGIEMEQMVTFGRYSEMYRARIDGTWVYFESLPLPMKMFRLFSNWADDKIIVKEVLRAGGIAVPRSISASTLTDAQEAFATLTKPIIVKPRSGSRGRHTTTYITSAAQLAGAFQSAHELCRYVTVEEHLEGSVCRATVVGGRLAGFFEAKPPRIIGDGAASIKELIARKNETRHERVGAVELTDEHRAFLSRLNLTEDSILQEGREIDLTHRTGRLFGGETRELLDTVHPKLRASVECAAKLLEIPVVGFDLIIKEPERDPDGQKWGIIEANTLPFIDLHYLPLYGTPSQVAVQVWDLWKR